MNWWETIFVLIAGLVVVPATVFVARQAMKRMRLSKALREMLIQLLRLGLYVLLLAAVLYSLGLTGLAATLSGSLLVVGVAMSQAFKELLADMIAGLSIARDHDFEIGYTIEIAGKFKGIIKKVDSRKIRLVDDKGYTIVLPNSMVEKSDWKVLDRESKIKDTKIIT